MFKQNVPSYWPFLSLKQIQTILKHFDINLYHSSPKFIVHDRHRSYLEGRGRGVSRNGESEKRKVMLEIWKLFFSVPRRLVEKHLTDRRLVDTLLK